MARFKHVHPPALCVLPFQNSFNNQPAGVEITCIIIHSGESTKMDYRPAGLTAVDKIVGIQTTQDYYLGTTPGVEETAREAVSIPTP